MSGTIDGGRKARDSNIRIHGEDFYRNIGRKGGSKKGVKKGFAANPALAAEAGAKGGTISKRPKVVKEE